MVMNIFIALTLLDILTLLMQNSTLFDPVQKYYCIVEELNVMIRMNCALLEKMLKFCIQMDMTITYRKSHGAIEKSHSHGHIP